MKMYLLYTALLLEDPSDYFFYLTVKFYCFPECQYAQNRKNPSASGWHWANCEFDRSVICHCCQDLGIRSHVPWLLFVVCCHALVVFIIFCIEGLVFVWSSVMHSPSVVSSLLGGFRVQLGFPLRLPSRLVQLIPAL